MSERTPEMMSNPGQYGTLNGMLVIRKEKGYTSNDVVEKLRGILHMRKIGHTGTLDPMAEGVLPVCLGNATKLTDLVADKDKEYVAVLHLGVTTDTQDKTGNVLDSIPSSQVRAILLGQNLPGQDLPGESCQGQNCPGQNKTDDEMTIQEEQKSIEQAVKNCASSFTGTICQLPPMYSAVHYKGKRLYDLARQGIQVERRPREVTISELEIQKVDLPFVSMRVVCSKGTYIRTLCEDMGNALGTGGTMESLLRSRVGCFTLEEAITLDEVETIRKQEGEEGIRRKIIPVDTLFAENPSLHVKEEALRFLQNGNILVKEDVTENELPHARRIRLYDAQGKFYALYRYDQNEEGKEKLIPVKVFYSPSSM